MKLDGYEKMEEIYRRCPPIPEPPFSDKECLKSVWGENWGFANDVGELKMVLVHYPDEEMQVIDESHYVPELDALIEKYGEWYWVSPMAPDLKKMQQEHKNLVKVLEDDGVKVVYMEKTGPISCKAIYTRDPGIMVPGGAVIGRLSTRMRRGEERPFTQTLAQLGVPILGTIHGTGLLEGGSFAYIDEKNAVVGQGHRINDEAIRQLENILAIQDIHLIVVPLTGMRIHVDGCFCMVDVKTALVHANQLPYWFLDTLKKMDVKVINVHPDERWGINSLAIRPGKVIMSQGNGRTAERLEREGIEVIQVDISEILKGGGGVHCSTFPLLRESV